jgi:hypothetical protein
MTLPSMTILLKAYFDLELAIAIPFCFTLVSFQQISCFQMSLPTLHAKGKTKQRDYKHHLK